jgi:hypothetical protein
MSQGYGDIFQKTLRNISQHKGINALVICLAIHESSTPIAEHFLPVDDSDGSTQEISLTSVSEVAVRFSYLLNHDHELWHLIPAWLALFPNVTTFGSSWPWSVTEREQADWIGQLSQRCPRLTRLNLNGEDWHATATVNSTGEH